MYLVLKQSICKQLDKKSMFPKEQNGVWGSQSPDMGLEFSSWREKQTIFFPSAFPQVLNFLVYLFLEDPGIVMVWFNGKQDIHD